MTQKNVFRTLKFKIMNHNNSNDNKFLVKNNEVFGWNDTVTWLSGAPAGATILSRSIYFDPNIFNPFLEVFDKTC